MVIVGLGNPGSEYAQTRHNAGFMVVDEVAVRLKAPRWQFDKKLKAETTKVGEFFLLKPQTFMNQSGQAVRAVLDYYKLASDQITVVFDDLDLALGTYKIQVGTGPKIHNGLNSIYQHLGTPDFQHVRIGVDSRAGDRSIPPERYVLTPFSAAERPVVQRVIDQVTEKLLH